MTTEAKDLVVLGAGPGGYSAAIRASQLGRKVTLIEREALGGVCLNWGCIPSKALLRTAQLYTDIKHAEEFGITVGDVKFDFPSIIARSRGVAEKLSGGVAYLMKKNKIETIFGNAKLLPGKKLALTKNDGGSTEISFNDIVIATGGRARTLPNIDVDGEVFHTARTILANKRLPQKLLVVGAGAIGIEFAYFFSSLGVQVTVAEMQNQILPVEDKEVATTLEKIFKKKGMIIKTNAKVENLKRSGKTASCTIEQNGENEKWSGDACLIAIGVIPNTDNLGLEDVGITTDRGFIQTNGFMQTNVAGYYAIGDVIGMPQLAHKASHEALLAAEAACGKAEHEMEYDNIPGCTYCQPQVASVGLTEEKAKEMGLKYRVGKMPFAAVGKAIAIGETDGFVKVIADESTGEILGAHILHAEATELISELVLARSHEAITSSVLETVHPHPTLAESVMEAMAIAEGRPINF